MKSNSSTSSDEILLRSTSQIVVDLIINSNDDREDVALGKYKRLGNTLDFIDFEKILVKQNVQADPAKPKKGFFR
jgi:hypothetical protein